MAWLPDIPKLAVATFEVLDGSGAKGKPFPVQFNPASLEYSVNNEFDDRNAASSARQFVKKTSAKLTMTLMFDTTAIDPPVDVRGFTGQVAKLLEPAKDGSKKFAPKVKFAWGNFSFKGVIEQYKETIDFFSSDGMPLRASLALTLASQELEFKSSKDPAPAIDQRQRNQPVELPPGVAPADVANDLGDPRSARAIAQFSGAVSLTAGAQASLSVGGEVQIGAAAGFSIGAGASAGLSASASAGSSFGLGGSVGAGFSATAGPAFAGLSLSPPSVQVQVDEARAALLGAPVLQATQTFQPGGRVLAALPGSVSARASLRFEE